MTTTRVEQRIAAPAREVYRALLDPDAVRQWMVPDGMTSRIHEFDARQGGTFRISLTYDAPTTSGKSSDRTDTFRGRFTKLTPDREVVQAIAFETQDPAMQGEMTARYVLTESEGGTTVVGQHEHLPPGISEEDNELGWRMSLAKLARLVEDASAEG